MKSFLLVCKNTDVLKGCWTLENISIVQENSISDVITRIIKERYPDKDNETISQIIKSDISDNWDIFLYKEIKTPEFRICNKDLSSFGSMEELFKMYLNVSNK